MFGGFFMDFFNKRLIKSVLFGIIITAASAALLMIIVSLILFKSGNYPKDYLIYISVLILAVSGFLGGYISGRIGKQSGMIIGAISGGVLFLVLTIAGLITSPSTITLNTLYKLIALVAFSALGGIIGVNKGNKIKI